MWSLYKNGGPISHTHGQKCCNRLTDSVLTLWEIFFVSPTISHISHTFYVCTDKIAIARTKKMITFVRN